MIVFPPQFSNKWPLDSWSLYVCILKHSIRLLEPLKNNLVLIGALSGRLFQHLRQQQSTFLSDLTCVAKVSVSSFTNQSGLEHLLWLEFCSSVVPPQIIRLLLRHKLSISTTGVRHPPRLYEHVCMCVWSRRVSCFHRNVHFQILWLCCDSSGQLSHCVSPSRATLTSLHAKQIQLICFSPSLEWLVACLPVGE